MQNSLEYLRVQDLNSTIAKATGPQQAPKFRIVGKQGAKAWAPPQNFYPKKLPTEHGIRQKQGKKVAMLYQRGLLATKPINKMKAMQANARP